MTVVSLPGMGPLVSSEGLPPVQCIIDAIEELLQEAREGRIRAIGFAIVRCNGVTGTRYEADPDECIAHQLTAATAYLHGRYVAHKLGISENP
jgi:hypothetical protein